MRGGASLPRMMAAPKRLAHTDGQQVRAGVWPLRVSRVGRNQGRS